MNTAPGHETAAADLGPLAWVLDELRKSLDASVKAFRRFVRDAEAARGTDLASVDTSQLRMARQQLHQAAGALDMVDMDPPARVVRAMEAAVQRFVQHPEASSETAAVVLEKASFALVEYLEGVLAGRPWSPVALFPQYREVQELAGSDRIHPADLWPITWRWRDFSALSDVQPVAYETATRTRLDTDVLKILKSGNAQASGDLSRLCAGLAASESNRKAATFWRLCAGFYEALSLGLVPVDAYSKRVASRTLVQYADLAKGNPEVSEQLARDLLFFCAQAALKPADNARYLRAAQTTYRLKPAEAVDYEHRQFGHFDPTVLMQARKRIHVAKEAWAAVCGGDLSHMRNLHDQFSLVGDSLGKLLPTSGHLAQSLVQSADMTVRSGKLPGAELSMEVATALLYLEAVFSEFDPSNADVQERSDLLAHRLNQAAKGIASNALEPWMEELYRRVSDRQTMGTVVGELRVSLDEIEKALDQYFRNPEQTDPLAPVPGALVQMRGVLSVLGLDQAAQATLHMRGYVEHLINKDLPDNQPVVDRLSNSLGAMGFLVDMLNYQPAMVKKLFVFDLDQGEFRPVMGRAKETTAGFDEAPVADVADAAAQPVRPVAPARSGEEVSLSLAVDGDHDLPALSEIQAAQTPVAEAEITRPGPLTLPELVAPPEPAMPSPAAPRKVEPAVARATATSAPLAGGPAVQVQPQTSQRAASKPAPLPVPPSDDDFGEDDLRDIFLEEAKEVIAGGLGAIEALKSDPSDAEQQTTLRRAFHTLKGSSRMVGLTDFGEAAWALEQVMNGWLADHKPVTHELTMLCSNALERFAQWAEAIGENQAGAWRPQPFQQAAEAFRSSGQLLAIEGPAADAPPMADDTAVVTEVAPVAQAVAELPTLSLHEPVPAKEQTVKMDEVPFDEAVLSLDLPSADPFIETKPSAPVQELEALPPLVQDQAAAAQAAAATPTPAAAAEGSAAIVRGDIDFESLAGLTVQDATATDAELAAFFAPQLQAAPEVTPVQPSPAIAPTAVEVVEPAQDFNDQTKLIGDLRISIPLYNVYLSEADEWARHLVSEMGEWALERHHRLLPESIEGRAHALAGSSATVGFTSLSKLARALEHALQRLEGAKGITDDQCQTLLDAADAIRHLLHQFAAGFFRYPSQDLLERLEALHAPEEEPSDADVQALQAFATAGNEAGLVIEEAPPVTPAAPLTVTLAPPVPVPAPVVPAPVVTPVPAMPGLVSVAPLKAVPAAPVAPVKKAPVVSIVHHDDDDIDVQDAIDPDLFPIFEEEADELLPQMGLALRQWVARPENLAARSEVLRALHTLKGSARLAGALRLGERAHRVESEVAALGTENLFSSQLEPLLGRLDELQAAFDTLRAGGGQPVAEESFAPELEPTPQAAEAEDIVPQAQAFGVVVPPSVAVAAPVVAAPTVPAAPMPMPAVAPLATVVAANMAQPPQQAPMVERQPAAAVVGSSEATHGAVVAPAALQMASVRAAANQVVRIRSQLLDRLMNQAGEVMITRSRLEEVLGQLRGSLGDLSDNLDRLRQQLRDIEVQSESQMQSRLAQAKETQHAFDPLEFDRFTRTQELTRMMAESVSDVATVQRNIQRAVEATEDDLIAQARQTRELQQDLLRTRLVEFDSLSERLYRVVRQASKDTGKQVRLDISGGTIEMDRSVLERMTPAFEHLLRNCVAHGVEDAAVREQRGKPATGSIHISLVQEGNDVAFSFEDDGAGLDLARIREKAISKGLIAPDHAISDEEATQLIFSSGFSTAAQVTEVAGRGVGMDVVRNEVQALGGRIEATSRTGQGATFRLILPLTTAVNQVVLLRAGKVTVGVPSNLIDVVRRVTAKDLKVAMATGQLAHPGQDKPLPFFWLGSLLQSSTHSDDMQHKVFQVVVFRSAAQRIAVHVDEVVGNQEVVVKNLGPQLSRLPGMAGMTLLASGAVIMIYNPVALATVYSEKAHQFAALHAAQQVRQVPAGAGAPLAAAPTTVVATTPAVPPAAAPATGLAAPALIVPVIPVVPPPMAAEPAAPVVPLVMVVDDSITVRRVTQRLLQREGYRVVLAADGLQALERLQGDELPTVVLSDIEMPRMDGFDLLRNIRADERLKPLPVIMITSRIAEKHREHAMTLGASHYLGKPYSEEELLGIIKGYARADKAVAA